MFKSYESVPITRQAFQIEDGDKLKTIEGSNTYELYRGMEQAIAFRAYDTPVAGDWVVRLTPEDTYHCTDAVFRERNIVK